MKLIFVFTIMFSFFTYANNKTFSGHLYKIDNKIYVSNSAENSKLENLIELDLYETKGLCFKNFNNFCQKYQIIYIEEINSAGKRLFKNVHLQKASGSIISKEIRIQNIPMH